MRSGTSFFDWTLFKKNVTRFWPIWASYLTIWMFVLPVNLMMQKMNYDAIGVGDIVSVSQAHLWFALFYGCFGAMAVLSHLYAPRSANFFGALPIRREGIFLTQYLSGLAFVVVPDLIVALFTALVAGASSGVLVWLAIGCGVYFFFYTLAILCGMMAGHILALPAFYAVLNGLAYAVTELFNAVMGRMYRTYLGPGSFVTEVVKWLTPVNKLNCSMYVLQGMDDRVEFSKDAVPLAVYAGVAVVMAAAAFLLYRARRTESAGDVVAVKFMRPVFKYGAAVCTGLLLGYLSTLILGDESLPYAIVVWTALGCFGAQMILDKTFRVFKKWKGAAAVTLAVAAGLTVMAFDLTGFDAWVPELEDVEFVEVWGLDGGLSSIDDTATWRTATLTQPEEIEKIIALHKLAGADRGEGDRGLYMEIHYHTKTGVYSRACTLCVDTSDVRTPGTAAYILEQLYTDRELYWRLYGFDELESFLESGGRFGSMSYSNYSDDVESYPELGYDYFRDNREVTITAYAAQMRLWEAIKADFMDGDMLARHVGGPQEGNERSIEIYWQRDEDQEVTDGYIADSPYNRVTISITISIPDTAERTIEALLEIIPSEFAAQDFLKPGEEQ